MKERKIIPTHERALLLEALCGKMDWSMNTHDEIGLTIKNIGLKSGSEASEAKAREIRELIETGISEAELLKKLTEMC